MEIRSLIFKRVKDYFSLTNLNGNSSRFFIKLFHYCNADAKIFLQQSFFDEKNRNLLYSRYACDVMDIIYCKLKSKEQIDIICIYLLSNKFLLDHKALDEISKVSSLNVLSDLVSAHEAGDSCKGWFQCILL